MHDLSRRQRTHARRGQLDGQRQAIEQPHDFEHRGTVAFLDREVAALRLCAGHEQLHGFVLEVERLDRFDHLTGKLQALAAGDHEARLRRTVEPGADRGGAFRLHLFEVVEDHQAPGARGNDVAELHGRIRLAQWHAQRQCHREVDAVPAARLRQVAEVDTARPFAQVRASVAANEACLADAAGAEQRQQARAAVEMPRERLQCRDTADEGIALGGQVVRDVARRLPQAIDGDDAVRLLGVDGRRPAIEPPLRNLDDLVDALQPVA
ncbi:MAG: hypothetical protein ABIZ18_00440, partial [Caldimonas sp.]